MSPLVVALVLGSAVLHAAWNALLRSGADRLWSMSVMCAICALVAAPACLVLPAPAAASWPYLLSSGAVQVFYALFLVRAYRTGLLAHVYPIARGTAPLLVTLGAAFLAGERPTPLGLTGVALVSTGIMAIAFGRGRPDGASLAAAAATGVFIATYMVIDGLGVRLSGHPIAYAAWQDVAAGLPMPFVYWIIRRAPPKVSRSPDLARSAAGAVISVIAYGVVVWAMSLSPLGQVSALRETSILFAAVLGVVFLKERITARRLLGAAMIAGGAIALSLG